MMKHRIAIYLPSLYGGDAERVMLTLANGLSGRGLPVDLVLADKRQSRYRGELRQQVRVVDLKANRVLGSLPALVRYLRHVHRFAMISAMGHANVVAVWAKRFSNVPIRTILTEHCVFNDAYLSMLNGTSKWLPFMMRKSYHFADVVVGVSHGVTGELKHLIGLSPQKVKTIYNPIDLGMINRLADEDCMHPWFMPGGTPRSPQRRSPFAPKRVRNPGPQLPPPAP